MSRLEPGCGESWRSQGVGCRPDRPFTSAPANVRSCRKLPIALIETDDRQRANYHRLHAEPLLPIATVRFNTDDSMPAASARCDVGKERRVPFEAAS